MEHTHAQHQSLAAPASAPPPPSQAQQLQYIVPMGYSNNGSSTAAPPATTEYVSHYPMPVGQHQYQAVYPIPPSQQQQQNEFYQQQQQARNGPIEIHQNRPVIQYQDTLAATAAPPPPPAAQVQVVAPPQQVPVQPVVQQQQTAIKKDKRRQTILNRLNKLVEKFVDEKDTYYRSNLRDLQMTLSSLHTNTNDQLLTKIADFNELRDAELTRLRLSEEYMVFRTVNMFKQEYDRTQENYENLIKQVKQKLYEKINKKIVKLKQEKALMDVSTSISMGSSSNGYHHHHGTGGSGERSSDMMLMSNNGSRSRRREESQRKRAAGTSIETEYDSGYDSANGPTTSAYNASGSQYHNNGSSRKKTKTSSAANSWFHGTNAAGAMTEDDLDQLTMDELDELLNDNGAESETTGGAGGSHHSTRGYTGHGSSSTRTTGGSGGGSGGGKKHKTVQDALKPLDDVEVVADLKLMKTVV